MATGGLPPSTTPNFDKVVRGHYPELDETAYAARATEQHANGLNAFASAETVTNMAVNVASNMQGETANAADSQFATRVANFTSQGATFENRSVATALSAQNILNAKTELNARAEAFDLEWEATKVRAQGEGWDQPRLQAEFDALLEQAKGDADAIASNFQTANSELKGHIAAGTEPSVPPSMPSGAPGAGAPSLELPPELMSQMQGMLGQGMGMAQSLPQSLQGLTGQVQPLVDPLVQAIQGAASGSGNVNVTPEMLDEMLAGQESGSGGDVAASSAPEAPSPEGFQGENSNAEPEEPKAEDTESEDKGDDEPAGEDTANSAPSPAASPVTQVAAPPESAKVPETTLSSDEALAELFS
ncbi:Uncharacterised protein [Mycobacteroides abscessus]|uniref:hypothetical protein n=1 Tax=Mycobacteroides abscessus TaxID=36809 RepID=UPI0005E5FF75|nr:hypothetical protein [Mycobacteroides abscessus]CPX20523.1 Uncharacterised protein [Mycobacteroides abscessus]CRG61202.1 Uncharacterised protein [Mycobacteroides abscessus]